MTIPFVNYCKILSITNIFASKANDQQIQDEIEILLNKTLVNTCTQEILNYFRDTDLKISKNQELQNFISKLSKEEKDLFDVLVKIRFIQYSSPKADSTPSGMLLSSTKSPYTYISAPIQIHGFYEI